MKGFVQVDNSIIWEDGSRTYPSSMKKAADPPKTYPWPPPSGGSPIEQAIETPLQSQSPPIQYNPGPLPPSLFVPPIAALPVSPSSDDVWNRWQAIVREWNCMIDWSGGIDALTAKIGGNMKLYPKGNDSRTAIGWWKAVQSQGWDQAQTFADLSKGQGVGSLFGVQNLIDQANEISVLARQHGFTGCPPPPVPPPAPTGLAVAATTSGSVSLSWTASAGAASYDVYRGGTKVSAGGVTSPSYTDSGLTPNTSYSYAVTAVSAAGSSAASNQVTATTSAAPPAADGTLAKAQGWWAGLSPRGKAATGVGLLVGVGLIVRGSQK